MCGFTGFYALSSGNSKRSRSEDFDVVRAMSDAIAHRGPDHGDVWQDPDVALSLGHRRLSILDLSEHGHQPMASISDRYVIVFNGEIYNHLELRKSHLADHDFKGHSDTETILALIEAIGFEKTLDVINGMFAFALWDRKGRVLHFARDRFGKKPLYIGWAGHSLVFGSELKAFHAHPDFKGEINREALSLYTQYNCVPAPHSIYKGFCQLKPGCSLTVEVDGLEKDADFVAAMKPFWSATEIVEKRSIKSDSYGDIVDEFERLLSTCVKDRMLSDVPIGAFLSGGIDSSAVVAVMQKQSDRPVHTYTIGFEEAGFNEADYARKVAQHLGTDHHEHMCSARDALDLVSKLPEMYDEPFADQSAIPTYLVAKFARRDVTVALSGDGGDEMLGGYSRHISAPQIAALPSFLRHGINAIPPKLLKTLFSTKPLMAKHLKKTSRLLSADTHAEMYHVLLGNWENSPVLSDADARLDLEDSELPLSEQLMLWDTLNYLPNDILTKVDRASMAVSLEARAPLLDRRIFEFAWQLPMNCKIRGGTGKQLLRDVLARHVPRDLFERPKKGFNIPIGEWLRGELRDWAEDLLDEGAIASQGHFDAAHIRDIWTQHLRGHGHHDEQLWAVLMFQSWYKHFHSTH